MRIKIYGITPDGKIKRDHVEIFTGGNAREIVQAMMAATPTANGQTEIAFITATLTRLGKSDLQLSNDPVAAGEKFIALLYALGLAERLPLTPLRVKLVGEDGNIFNLLGIVRRALRRGGYPELVDEVTTAVTSSHSYEEALAKFTEYVIVE